MLKANRLQDFVFFFSHPQPPTKHKCHEQGANSLQLGFYLSGPDAYAKMQGPFQWPTSRAVCTVTNACEAHTGCLSPSIWTEKPKLATQKSQTDSLKSLMAFQVQRQCIRRRTKELFIGSGDYCYCFLCGGCCVHWPLSINFTSEY